MRQKRERNGVSPCTVSWEDKQETVHDPEERKEQNEKRAREEKRRGISVCNKDGENEAQQTKNSAQETEQKKSTVMTFMKEVIHQSENQ